MPPQPPLTATITTSSQSIPPLNSIAPSIFVPLTDDISTFSTPRDRIARLKHILQTIDLQHDGVKQNLLYMFEREKQRLILAAQEAEEKMGVQRVREGVTREEEDEVVRNMEARPSKKEKGEVGEYDPWKGEQQQGFVVPQPDMGVRERAVADLINVIERGVLDLQAFEKYTEGIRTKYLELLEREVVRLEEAGKRPEERTRTD